MRLHNGAALCDEAPRTERRSPRKNELSLLVSEKASRGRGGGGRTFLKRSNRGRSTADGSVET